MPDDLADTAPTLLDRADYWLAHMPDRVTLAQSVDYDLVKDLAVALRAALAAASPDDTTLCTHSVAAGHPHPFELGEGDDGTLNEEWCNVCGEHQEAATPPAPTGDDLSERIRHVYNVLAERAPTDIDIEAGTADSPWWLSLRDAFDDLLLAVPSHRPDPDPAVILQRIAATISDFRRPNEAIGLVLDEEGPEAVVQAVLDAAKERA